MQTTVNQERMLSVKQFVSCLRYDETAARISVEDAVIGYALGTHGYDELTERRHALELVQSELWAAKTVLGKLGLYSGE